MAETWYRGAKANSVSMDFCPAMMWLMIARIVSNGHRVRCSSFRA
jgi:hypothetical protein